MYFVGILTKCSEILNISLAVEADKFRFDLWKNFKTLDFLAVIHYMNTWLKWYSSNTDGHRSPGMAGGKVTVSHISRCAVHFVVQTKLQDTGGMFPPAHIQNPGLWLRRSVVHLGLS